VHSEQFGTCVKICLEKWCITLHYFAFLYMYYGTKELNFYLLEVHCSLEFHHTAIYTLKNSIEGETRCGRVREYYNKLQRLYHSSTELRQPRAAVVNTGMGVDTGNC
jgi:hypothetical protein